MNKKDLEQIRQLIKEELGTKPTVVIDKDIEPKFVVGKWYRWGEGRNLDFLGCFTGAKYDRFEYYGFNVNGKWKNEDYYGLFKPMIPATDKEVEDALIKEAKKRGFKEGVGFSGVSISGKNDGSPGECDEKFKYDSRINTLVNPSRAYIFSNGRWATIIEGTQINGKDVTIKDGTITIGCTEQPVMLFKDMLESLDLLGIDSLNHSEVGKVLVSELKGLVK